MSHQRPCSRSPTSEGNPTVLTSQSISSRTTFPPASVIARIVKRVRSFQSFTRAAPTPSECEGDRSYRYPHSRLWRKLCQDVPSPCVTPSASSTLDFLGLPSAVSSRPQAPAERIQGADVSTLENVERQGQSQQQDLTRSRAAERPI